MDITKLKTRLRFRSARKTTNAASLTDVVNDFEAVASELNTSVVKVTSSDGGLAFQKDMKYALYESGGRVSFGSELESSSFGATGRFEVATIVIPPQFCEPGTAVEVDFQFACSANTVTKTFLVCPTENQVDKVDISRLKGASAVYDAALGVASVMAKAYFDIVSRDVVKGGQVSATSGYGSVTSAAAKNPRTLPLNSRRGIAIVLGVDIGAAQTGTADIAITTGVFTKTAHGLAVGQPIILSGAPPAPLVAGERYFVSAVLSADTWTVSDTTTGTPISTTAAGAAIAYSAYSVATLTRARATVFKE